jgi:hypothetical protein
MPISAKVGGHISRIFPVFAATLVVVGFVATAAQAEPVFEAVEIAESEEWNEEVPIHATLDASQVGAEPVKLTLVPGLPVTCESVTANATLATESPTATFSPSFAKCKVTSFGIAVPAEVKFGSCHYVVHAKEEVEEDLSTATADITCEGKEEKILITIKNTAGTKTKCLVHVPPQSGLSLVHLENMPEASPESFTLKNEVGSIEAQVTNGEEPCLIAPGTYKKATLTGNTTVTATGTGEVKTPPAKVKSKKYDFEWEEANEILAIQDTGQQVFTFEVGQVKCNTVYMSRPVVPASGFATAIFENPENMEECKFGALEAEVKFRECRYRFWAGLFEFNEFAGNTTITCPVNRFIEVITPQCTIKIFEQEGKNSEGLKRVTYVNQKPGARRELTVELHLREIKYEEEGEGAGCNNETVLTNGKYDGKLLFWGGFTFGLQGELWAERLL